MLAVVLLIVSILLQSRKSLMLALIIAASAASVLMTCWFLVEITPIAQGNNDSGEVFWFVVFPAIGLFIYACISYSKLKTLRTNTR